MNRKTADTINDDELDALYVRLEAAEELLRRYVQLADVTHKYRIQGGHDVLGANLTCAGCALRDEIAAVLAPAQRPGVATGAGQP